MAAPVGDGVELDAVGELHLVLLVEPPLLLGPLARRSLVGLIGWTGLLAGRVRRGPPWRVFFELDLVANGAGRARDTGVLLGSVTPPSVARLCQGGSSGRIRATRRGGMRRDAQPWNGPGGDQRRDPRCRSACRRVVRDEEHLVTRSGRRRQAVGVVTGGLEKMSYIMALGREIDR